MKKPEEIKNAQEAALRLREWYEAFEHFGKGHERTVKELLEVADLIENLAAELETVKRERDALWKAIKMNGCTLCKYRDNDGDAAPCKDCTFSNDLFELRGVEGGTVDEL